MSGLIPPRTAFPALGPAPVALSQRALRPLAGLFALYVIAVWLWSGLDPIGLFAITGTGLITSGWLFYEGRKMSVSAGVLGRQLSALLAGNAWIGALFLGFGATTSVVLGLVCLLSSHLLDSSVWLNSIGGATLLGWTAVMLATPQADPLAVWACPALAMFALMLHAFRSTSQRALQLRVDSLRSRVAALEAEKKEQAYNAALKADEARRVLDKRGETEGLWDWELSSDRMTFSPRWGEMLGYSKEEIGETPESWLNLIHPHDLSRTLDRLTAHLEGREAQFECEHRIQVRDGGYCWVLSRGQALLGENGKPERILGSQIHLGRLKSFESKLLHDATHDRLTGLPNRHYLLARLREDVARAGRNERYGFAVVFLDLDGFKSVNDSLGHLAGDRLLAMVGKRLGQSKRPEDTVARLGGDEFVMILRNLRDEADALTLASRIQEALSEPFELADQELVTGSSMGIAMYGPEIARTEDLLRNADIAMYHAKSSRKGAIQIFDTEMHVRTRRLWNLQTDLRGAIERDELRLMYQPFVNLETGQICGAEALIRWHRSDGELVSPAEFIPLAEEQGLISAIGEWTLRTACVQSRVWQDAGLRPVKVSVNLSAKQLSNHEFAETVRRVIAETRIEPRWLQLELTETALMGSIDATPASLYSLFCMDVQLAIDDFGTGYSSLDYLRKLQFDTLKIDKSFVDEIAVDRRAAALARSIISMAHSLRMSSLAEGVETPEQLEVLRAYGCHMIQGYLASRPVPAQEFGELLHRDARLLAEGDASRQRTPRQPSRPKLNPTDRNLAARIAALSHSAPDGDRPSS